MYPKHDEDRYGWAIHMAHLLKDKKMNEVDFDSIIEEMEAVGRSEKHELISRLSVLIAHLLKWQYQNNMKGHSWLYTIREQRDQALLHIHDNPSLKHKLDEILTVAYKLAKSRAAKETSLEDTKFPQKLPYTFEQLMDEAFYPEAV